MLQSGMQDRITSDGRLITSPGNRSSNDSAQRPHEVDTPGRKRPAGVPLTAPATDPLTNTQIAELVDFVTSCKRMLVLTGAGCSTESNIPDYRGPKGAYSTGFQPMTHQQACLCAPLSAIHCAVGQSQIWSQYKNHDTSLSLSKHLTAVGCRSWMSMGTTGSAVTYACHVRCAACSYLSISHVYIEFAPLFSLQRNVRRDMWLVKCINILLCLHMMPPETCLSCFKSRCTTSSTAFSKQSSPHLTV